MLEFIDFGLGGRGCIMQHLIATGVALMLILARPARGIPGIVPEVDVGRRRAIVHTRPIGFDRAELMQVLSRGGPLDGDCPAGGSA